VTQREGNRIIFGSTVYAADITGALVCLYQTQKAGFDDVILDFSGCTAVLPTPILAICARVINMREKGVGFSLLLPKKHELNRHFVNANWAHLLGPTENRPSQFRGFTILPATHFRDSDEQHQAVNRILDGILGAIPGLSREGLAALEWSVSEITDNVLVHAQSPVGGLVQMSMFKRTTKRIEYIVVDAGVGIPKTLRQSHPELTSDSAALEQAIREGVTRDKDLGQGNGLYGSFQVSSHSRGIFHLQSGFAKLAFTAPRGLQVTTEKVPFDGTLISAQIDLSDPKLLQEALIFGGRRHVPVDFVETHYEHFQRPEVQFVLKNETHSVGSRLAGTPLRNKLMNLLQMCPSQKIVFDFQDIQLISSSFADEVFAKLFVDIGPTAFAQRFEFLNLPALIRQLIDKAIAQRMAKRSGA
jgi:hypothetical protein